MKKCSNCKKELNDECFGKSKKLLSGLRSRCKRCDTEIAKEIYRRKSRGLPLISETKVNIHPGKLGSKEYVRSAALKQNYNITKDDYDKLYNKQKGRCEICKTHQSDLNKTLSVDHNHSNNKIRGLLCQNCNSVLGLCKEDVDILLNTIDYIHKYNS